MEKVEYLVKETPDTLCYRASCAKDDHEAQKFLLQAFGMKPDHVQTNYNLGLLYRKWGNIDEAMIHFTKVETFSDSLYHIGKLYLANGDQARALEKWEQGSKRGCLKCRAELVEYHFSNIKIDDPSSVEGFRKCNVDGIVPKFISESRYNYIAGVFWLTIGDRKHAQIRLSGSDYAEAHFLIWKHYLETPKDNLNYLAAASAKGHPEAMFEYGKKLIGQVGDFEKGVGLIIDSKFDGYLDYLFEVYKNRLEKGLVSLKPIKTVLPYDKLKNLAEIGEKTNLKRERPDSAFLEECADYHLTKSKVRILINKMYSGNNTTAQQKELFQRLLRFASEGDLDAKLQVARCYNSGNGVKMDRKEAEAWYRNAAENGCRQAQQQLAWWLRSGDEPTMEQLKESRTWTERCLELRQDEREVPDKEKYLRILKKVDNMIQEIKENEEEHKALILFKGPRREGRDEFLFQAARLFDQAEEGNLESAMLVGMVFGMTGMKDKNREWFDKAIQKKDDFPLSGPPEAGRTTTGGGQRCGEWESFPSKITPKDSQFRTVGQGIRAGEMEKDSYPKAEKLEEDDEEEFIDIASGLDNLD